MIHSVEFFRKMFRMMYEGLFTILLVIFISVIMLKEEPESFAYIIIGALFIISYFVREWSRRNIYNFLLHGIQGILITNMPLSRGMCILILLVEIYLFMASAKYIGRGGRLKPLDDIPWPTFLISFIIYLYGVYIKSELLIEVTLIIPVMLLVLYYIMTYLEGLKIYIDSTKDVQGLPLSRVVFRNNIIVFSVVLLLILAIVVGINMDFSILLNGIRNVFLAIINFIGSLFMLFFMFLNKMISTGESSVFVPDTSFNQQASEYADSVAASFEVLIYAGLIILAAFVLWKLIRFILKRLFKMNRHENDIVEVAESVKDNRITKKRVLFGKRASLTERARRAYRQGIERYRYSIKLECSKTCRNIEEEIINKEAGDVSELTDLYADIRYGETKVDKKLLKRINILSKQ